MKTQAWGWLASGVLALGLNGFYHDGGAAWAHRAMQQVAARVLDRSEGVIALATGRADWFLAKVNGVAAREETASCRVATAVARVQTRMARTRGGFAQVEAVSARQEAALARVEARQARIEARTAARMARVEVMPASFNTVTVPAVCPRVHVRIPRVNVPQVEMPEIQISGLD